ncbi:MAG: lytic transglycosylase domain-containing protein [Trueperaceae bacterium]
MKQWLHFIKQGVVLIKYGVVVAVLGFSSGLACTLSEELAVALEEAATYYGIEPFLLHALVYQESRYCTDALSPKGAIGLGQLMPGTAAGLGVDPHDPVQNLYGAAAYLRQQWDTFEDWQFALAAYNAGPGAVQKYQGIPPYEETQNYVIKVLDYYTSFAGETIESSQATATLTGPDLGDVSEAERQPKFVSALAPLEGFEGATAEGAVAEGAVAEGAAGETAEGVVVAVPTVTVEVAIPKPPLLIVSNKKPATAPLALPMFEKSGLTLFDNEEKDSPSQDATQPEESVEVESGAETEQEADAKQPSEIKPGDPTEAAQSEGGQIATESEETDSTGD